MQQESTLFELCIEMFALYKVIVRWKYLFEGVVR